MFNAVNDTVNNRTTAAANMNKVPFYYGPPAPSFPDRPSPSTSYPSPIAPRGNGILTEIFGTTAPTKPARASGDPPPASAPVASASACPTAPLTANRPTSRQDDLRLSRASQTLAVGVIPTKVNATQYPLDRDPGFAGTRSTPPTKYHHRNRGHAQRHHLQRLRIRGSMVYPAAGVANSTGTDGAHPTM